MSRQLARGLRLVELKRYAEAADEFVQASATPDYEVHGLALGAGSLAASGDLKGAEELIERARRLDPEDDAVLVMDSSVQLLKGKPAQARSCMMQLLAKHPTDVDLLALASTLELANSDRQSARAHAERGLALDPAHEGCLEAVIATLGPQSPELPEFTRRLLACAPENTAGHISLAGMAHAEDRLDEAGHHLAEALRRDPSSFSAHALRGRLAASRHPLYRFLTEGRLGRRRIALGWRIAALFLPMILWLVCFAIFFAEAGEAPAVLRRAAMALMPQTLAVLWVILILFWHSWYAFACAVRHARLRLIVSYGMPDFVLPCALGMVGLLAVLAYIFTNDASFFGVACLAPLVNGSLALALGRSSPSARTSGIIATSMMAIGIGATLLDQWIAFSSGAILWSLALLNIALWCVLVPKPDTGKTTPPPLPA